MTPREIGKILKEAREKKGLTLNKIWNTTRMQGRIIEALEAGAAENILSRIYVVLFLKKYAAFLGLDARALAENYKAFHRAPEERVLERGPAEKKPSPAINIDLRKWALLAVSCLLLFMSVYFILFLGVRLKSFYRARKTVARAAPKPKTVPRTKIAKKTVFSKKAQKIFPIAKGKPINLSLRARAEVWMKAWKDGKVVFEGTLGKNKTKSWSAVDNLKIWAGRAEALDFTINGTIIGKVGKGNVKNIEISKSGLRVKKKWLIGRAK